VRPVGAITAGFLGDRTGPSKVMLIGFGLMLVGEIILFVLPGEASLIGVLIVSCLFMYLAMYVCQSMHYALMSEADYPLSLMGTAVGLIATLGYLPEWIIPWVGGVCLDSAPGAAGYKTFFGILIVLACIGFAATLVWLHITKDKRAQIRAEAEAQRKGEGALDADSETVEAAEAMGDAEAVAVAAAASGETLESPKADSAK